MATPMVRLLWLSVNPLDLGNPAFTESKWRASPPVQGTELLNHS
jgi:hypothetical protein